MNKKIVFMGGGTISHVRAHMALAAPAYGNTARTLHRMALEKILEGKIKMDADLVLTKMADSSSKLETNQDVSNYVDQLINDNTTKIVFFNCAMCDFDGKIGTVESGKYAERLSTKEGTTTIELTPADKVITKIRKHRKDIFLVGFKTTCGDTQEQMFAKGLNLLKKASCNLVVVNDIETRVNFIITPEEGVYGIGMTRDEVLQEALDIAYLRTHLTFTRSTVVGGTPVKWDPETIPAALHTVVNWCVEQGAYKKFNGATTGHFAAKVGEREFLTSIRKTNFNQIDQNGMVRVVTDGDDSVISYGAKPSVGGQSQRIIFTKYGELDCIVHFHCPLKADHKDQVPTVSQRAYECGSHQCGENTANGLAEVRPGIYAVMLDKHGPNIVFNHGIDPNQVIDFIRDNFDLDKATSGFERAYLDLVS